MYGLNLSTVSVMYVCMCITGTLRVPSGSRRV